MLVIAPGANMSTWPGYLWTMSIINVGASMPAKGVVAGNLSGMAAGLTRVGSGPDGSNP